MRKRSPWQNPPSTPPLNADARRKLLTLGTLTVMEMDLGPLTPEQIADAAAFINMLPDDSLGDPKRAVKAMARLMEIEPKRDRDGPRAQDAAAKRERRQEKRRNEKTTRR